MQAPCTYLVHLCVKTNIVTVKTITITSQVLHLNNHYIICLLRTVQEAIRQVCLTTNLTVYICAWLPFVIRWTGDTHKLRSSALHRQSKYTTASITCSLPWKQSWSQPIQQSWQQHWEQLIGGYSQLDTKTRSYICKYSPTKTITYVKTRRITLIVFRTIFKN